MSAPIGEWQWNRTTQRLRLSLEPPVLGRQLSGEWTLEDLSYVLDGLSRQRLRSGLETPNGDVALELVTAEGLEVHLAGGRVDEEMSRGVILSVEEEGDDEVAQLVELLPVFQPIVGLRSRKIEGFEALARWGTEQGLQAPVGDNAGLASTMLLHAAEAVSHFRRISGNKDLFMQVNITSLDLADGQLVDLISALQSGHDLAPRSIRLELTEQDALRDTEQTLKRLHELREVGAGVVLDDFGSGHSSFQWLADLPADALKVDASLVQQIENPRVETILEALTLMSRRLGMTSTAEGVEDERLMGRLRSLGFDHAQGFALGRPMSVNKIEKFLRN
ncbi:MAG: EAL domain-containing protein [Henriciella sp.]|nr:EAL domain-containing protein [Henriciella sp.]